MSTLLCLGMGYTATVFARRLRARGWRIAGTGTTEDAVKRLEAEGWAGILFDGLGPSQALAARLAEATHVLVSIPPEATGDPALQWHEPDILAAPALRWIGYLSTIGVYGDHKGAWVDETTPARPVSERSGHRLEAEAAWLGIGERRGVTVQIFRLAGIYGPGRNALEHLRTGTARRVVKPGQVFNRIHVDDIAQVLEAAVMRGGSHTIYNVTDDEPAPAQDVVAYAAEISGLPLPPAIAFDDAAFTPMARSFYAENKRVSNRRIKEDLGVRLAFPTYRQGLRSLLA